MPSSSVKTYDRHLLRVNPEHVQTRVVAFIELFSELFDLVIRERRVVLHTAVGQPALFQTLLVPAMKLHLRAFTCLRYLRRPSTVRNTASRVTSVGVTLLL